MSLAPFSWKDRPALMESLFPVQKISIESFKEQMAGSGKTLTALGSYWKGRKPLYLNKACVLGCLLPASDDSLRDLEIFELLMGMDDRSLAVRHGRIHPDDIARRLTGLRAADWFDATVDVELPDTTPFQVEDIPFTDPKTQKPKRVRLKWKDQVPETERLRLEALALPFSDYKSNVDKAKRCEELGDAAHAHIWAEVNTHLGTQAHSFPELVEQMGIARFGHRPRVADVFSGSGQIPFEAARLGCDVYASDLNPIACMLTWGAFHIVGAAPEKRKELELEQQRLAATVQEKIDALGVEEDGKGWRAKVFLYCVEVICPETGWKVPLLPSMIISKGYRVIAELVPLPEEKRYDITVRYLTDQEDLEALDIPTVQDGSLVHSPDGTTIYRTSIKAIRGDYKEDKENKNRLRLWEKSDFVPRPDDVFQERLYAIQWMRLKPKGKQWVYEFRSVTADDLRRDQIVVDYVREHLNDWQEQGFVHDMKIEGGFNTDQPIREKGWTYWHQLFNPRQLLVASQIRQVASAQTTFLLTCILDINSKVCRWNNSASKGAGGNTSNTFDNQALNTLLNYGTRSLGNMINFFEPSYKTYPICGRGIVKNNPANSIETPCDVIITDPPYGDAVKYEEITEFFIAWLRKNPPKEFADWTWDSRRALAIKGEDEAFRQSMIRAYRRTREMMPDNGIQVLMFTHQSGSIWADMASIIWASGLQVTASWYVVTETDSALRQGANVTGTIMLVLRKRLGQASSFRDDLGWEIEAAVKQQIEGLTGLDQKVRDKGSEGLYTDADLQMAGYAAALKVLTAYSHIDGKDMVIESEAPKQSGKKSFVDDLIDFAVQTAVQFLVPLGFEKSEWQKLSAIERFYLKMAEMEAMGEKSLDNYQNFAKAFKVKHFGEVMSDDSKANHARLKLSTELKAAHMSGDGELSNTPLRALLYALFELSKNVEVEDVLNHLGQTYPHYLRDKKLLAKIADYLADKRALLKPTKSFTPDDEASHARVLAEAIRNQKL
jgi:putative DNA methylase